MMLMFVNIQFERTRSLNVIQYVNVRRIIINTKHKTFMSANILAVSKFVISPISRACGCTQTNKKIKLRKRILKSSY